MSIQAVATQPARSFFAMFDSCDIYKTASGFDITVSGDGFRPSDPDGMITASSHVTEEAAYVAAQEHDDSAHRRVTHSTRPVDQRHYQTGCGVEGERLYMPDR